MSMDNSLIGITTDPFFSQASCGPRVTYLVLDGVGKEPPTLSELSGILGATAEHPEVSLMVIKQYLEAQGLHTYAVEGALTDLQEQFPSHLAILHTHLPGRSDDHYVVLMTDSAGLTIVDAPELRTMQSTGYPANSDHYVQQLSEAVGFQGKALFVSSEPFKESADNVRASVCLSLGAIALVTFSVLLIRNIKRKLNARALRA